MQYCTIMWKMIRSTGQKTKLWDFCKTKISDLLSVSGKFRIVLVCYIRNPGQRAHRINRTFSSKIPGENILIRFINCVSIIYYMIFNIFKLIFGDFFHSLLENVIHFFPWNPVLKLSEIPHNINSLTYIYPNFLKNYAYIHLVRIKMFKIRTITKIIAYGSFISPTIIFYFW